MDPGLIPGSDCRACALKHYPLCPSPPFPMEGPIKSYSVPLFKVQEYILDYIIPSFHSLIDSHTGLLPFIAVDSLQPRHAAPGGQGVPLHRLYCLCLWKFDHRAPLVLQVPLCPGSPGQLLWAKTLEVCLQIVLSMAGAHCEKEEQNGSSGLPDSQPPVSTGVQLWTELSLPVWLLY